MAKGFEDYMTIVNDSHQKTAGSKDVNPGILSKLAQELEGTGASAPKAEGEITGADSSVTGAATAVASATDAVAVPQEVMAGADPAEKPAGEKTPAIKPNEGTAISAGDGKVTDANNFSKEPDAVAAAAQPTNKDGEPAAVPVAEGVKNTKTASVKEAEEIGRVMARSFVEETEKIAVDNQYSEALEVLKEAGLLKGYNIKAEIEKDASANKTCLEKISEKLPLSKTDIVTAAQEFVTLEKNAADADEAGRKAARDFIASITKQAEGEDAAAAPAAEAPAETPAETPAAETSPTAAAPAAEKPAEAAPAASAAPAAASAAKTKEAEKTSADQEVVNALKVLKEKGLLV